MSKKEVRVSDPVTSSSGRIYSWKGVVLLKTCLQLVDEVPTISYFYFRQ